ncbi:hypothetical protein DQ04_02861070 [Trypanosoma grayi]|uniref:hypothetical protein n=1 Tax=Trypanosoma grayi TaxID=71804 RepID=UPI0004F42EFF|nr:hypothetical protein DQ04_02861070 [Trypanosoma grayi]KEG11207.1 hypothetical protein DQ04_02861070 [Trypanosoma grayi]
MSFLWLAVSTVFYGVAGRECERPNRSAVIPEEHSSFKEFFMSDLRARVLQYTMHPHSELAGGKTPSGYQTYLRQIKRWADEENEGEGALQPRAAQAFNYSPGNVNKA